MQQQREIIDEIAKHLGVAPQDIDLEASLTDDLGLGKVERADLLSDLSERFNVLIDDSDAEQVNTVGDLVELLEDLSLEE